MSFRAKVSRARRLLRHRRECLEFLDSPRQSAALKVIRGEATIDVSESDIPEIRGNVWTLRDLSDGDKAIITKAKPFTMTSVERMAAVIAAIDHIVAKGIPGDIAECGVWRGGSMMVAAMALVSRNDVNRSLYLYDTFEGMTEPSAYDRDLDSISADAHLTNSPARTGFWCYAGLEEVRTNMLSTGYPEDRMHLIKGDVEDVIPQASPNRLAFLRLDTDWYASTKHELTYLYPLLSEGGILIVDDYGHWQGAKKAVDEYFEELKCGVFLHRIDYSGRLVVKQSTVQRRP